MFKAKDGLFFTISILAMFLAGCSPAQAVVPTLAAPGPGQTSISGKVPAAAERWRNRSVEIYAAPYYDDGSGEGFFLLDPNLHPRTTLETGGIFLLSNISPGQYVLVVGVTVEEGRQVVESDGKVRIFTFLPGEVYPLGELSLAP